MAKSSKTHKIAAILSGIASGFRNLPLLNNDPATRDMNMKIYEEQEKLREKKAKQQYHQGRK